MFAKEEDGTVGVTWAELFIPTNTSQNTFSLTFETDGDKCLVTIYETDILQPNDTYATGDKVGLFYPDLYCNIEVWEKYFLTEFFERYQMYHPGGSEDDVKTMGEVLEYARRRGLEEVLNAKDN